MENKNLKKSGFTYSYSAKEQAELKRIRDKYSAPTEAEDKMTRLRKLDASVTRKAVAVSLVFGVIGILIFGFGMSLCMEKKLSEMLSISSGTAMLVGILNGAFGGVIMSLAYPIYNIIYRRRRKKVGPEIIRITDELMK